MLVGSLSVPVFNQQEPTVGERVASLNDLARKTQFGWP
jgi:hypothetical protein